jgi:hypothetical protein
MRQCCGNDFPILLKPIFQRPVHHGPLAVSEDTETASSISWFYNVVELMTVVVLGLVIPAVVIARVIFEISADLTPHNLWPLELVLAAFISFPISSFGALCGFVIASLWGKPTNRSGA